MGAENHPAEMPLERLLGRRQPTRAGGRRRGTYRVQSTELGQIHAALLVDGVKVGVTLLDLSARGAGVRTDKTGERALERAAAAGATNHITLELGLPGGGPTVASSAHAVQASTDPDGLRLGLRLAPADREALEARLLPLFNQRRALRVSPPPRQRVMVRVLDGTGERLGEGHMVNLSVEGMGLRLDDASADSLAVGDAVILRFVVSGSREPVRISARVRHIYATRDGAHIAGLAFDPDHEDAAHTRTRVGAYIVRRQLQMRRRG